ncbi:MAG: transporter, ATP-binding protein [candidate division NC10 bacterium]|nr:transporter, ATP-binding protein [candidate division NC10 bacterium]
MAEEIILETNGLGKRYKKRWAVNDLNLSVRRGDVFGFLGPNGAGKSTTIRMILTLVKPTTGGVRVFGTDVTRRRGELARVGGLVERPDFYLYLSARRNLEIVAALRGRPDRRQIDEVLDIVGLLARADDAVRTFSHGMKQRLGIAQALLGFPDLVILDEPTSGLDPHGIKEVRELIRRLAVERSMTIFLSSHLLHEIEQTATRMAIINNGSTVVQGGVNDLLADGTPMVTLQASPLEEARRVVAQFPGVTRLEVDGAVLRFSADRGAIPALARRLVEEHIAIDSIVPRRSLEEYFLALTEGASDVPRNAPGRR